MGINNSFNHRATFNHKTTFNHKASNHKASFNLNYKLQYFNSQDQIYLGYLFNPDYIWDKDHLYQAQHMDQDLIEKIIDLKYIIIYIFYNYNLKYYIMKLQFIIKL